MQGAKKDLPVRIETNGVPVYLYADPAEVEPEALKQLVAIAESPLPVGYVSAMPDVHVGKGVTVGTVFASDKYICPNAIGVDIGCGMCAVPIQGLHKDSLTLEQKRRIQDLIKRRIPTGFDEHRAPLKGAKEALDEISCTHQPSSWLEQKVAKEAKVAKQLGTLGGGNHFLELVHDEEGRVWVMLHSGSRNVGNTTAQHYDELAVQEMKKRGQDRARKEGINYLAIESSLGQAYLQDMLWCQDYAKRNRSFMLDLMVEAVEEVTGKGPDMQHAVNAHHNFCACEDCRVVDPRTGLSTQRRLWVTRKGATSARPGQPGIIPGSMGTGSFIVTGKGEPLAWSSCSHGAGRKMSRTRAAQEISQADFEAAMKGIVCDVDPRVRDEAPQAYKDLGTVMDNQRSLVQVQHRLLPLVNVKGITEPKKWGKGRGSSSKSA